MQNTTDSRTSMVDVTVHSLEMSMDGLDALSGNSVQCGELLLSDMNSGLAQFEDLVGSIRAFYVFENDVRSVFGVEGESIRDAAGDLGNAEKTLAGLMAHMVASLDAHDFQRLSGILKTGVPGALDRFSRLLPLLRQHILNEHLVTTS